MLNLPNMITIGRLASVPVILWLVLHGRIGPALVLFLVSCVSDAVDGWLARRYGGNWLGAVLDPLADKALLAGSYVTLTVLDMVPLWLTVLVLFRDFMVLGGVVVLWLLRGVTIQPLYISKLNTVFQMALIAVSMMPLVVGWEFPNLAATLCWCVAATTIASGTAYLWSAVSGRATHKRRPATAAVVLPRG